MSATCQDIAVNEHKVFMGIHIWNMFWHSPVMNRAKDLWESVLRSKLASLGESIWNTLSDVVSPPELQKEADLADEAIKIFNLDRKIDQTQTASQKVKNIFSHYKTEEYFNGLFQGAGISSYFSDEPGSTFLAPFSILSLTVSTMYVLLFITFLSFFLKKEILRKGMYMLYVVNVYSVLPVCLLNLSVANELANPFSTSMRLGLEHLLRLYPYRWMYLQIFTMVVFGLYHSFLLKYENKEGRAILKKVPILILFVLGALVQNNMWLLTKDMVLTQSSTFVSIIFFLVNIVLLVAIAYSLISVLRVLYQHFIKPNASKQGSADITGFDLGANTE